MTEHNLLTGSSLHEPKGVSAALAGQAYIADGVGSGAWTALPPLNLTRITQESDFPVQDATTITLVTNQIYQIAEDVTTAKRFIVQDSSKLTSFNFFGPTLTYTGTGSMFTGVDASFSIKQTRIDAPNAQLFDFTDTIGGLRLFLMDTVRMVSATKFGTFNNMQTVLLEGSSILDADDGITITGTSGIVMSINKVFLGSTSASFIGLDLGTSVSQTTELFDFIVSAPAGAIGISGLVSSGNIPVGRLAMVTGCEFGGGMTAPLQNIVSSDLRWDFQGNSPISDSRNAADIYLTGGSDTITTGSAGDWQEIGVPSTAIWASDIASRFTIGTDGVVTYIGERDIQVKLSGRATVEKSGGGSDVLEVRIAKNWNGTVSDSGLEKSRAQTQSTDPTTVPIGAITTLVTNDNIRVIFSNTTGASDIIANVSALEVID